MGNMFPNHNHAAIPSNLIYHKGPASKAPASGCAGNKPPGSLLAEEKLTKRGAEKITRGGRPRRRGCGLWESYATAYWGS